MTPIGAAVLFICFLGPILPPVVGFVVGSIVDVLRRKREPQDVRARRRIAATTPAHR